MARFQSLIAENARQSVANEPGCRQFDVLQPQESTNRIILYEVYDDFAAFQAHTKMPHVAAFFAEARPMIVNQKSIRSDRLFASTKS
jgi:quinol monooxygenase YgiN